MYSEYGICDGKPFYQFVIELNGKRIVADEDNHFSFGNLQNLAGRFVQDGETIVTDVRETEDVEWICGQVSDENERIIRRSVR